MGEFYQTLKELLMPILRIILKIAVQETLSYPFHENSITLIPKHDNTTRKENCRSISLINIHAKIVNKIPAN